MSRRTRHCPSSGPTCVKPRIARTGGTGYRGALPPAGPSTIPRSSRMTRIVLALLATLLLASAAHAAEPAAAGACGSQAKVPADQRVTNTARWTTASESNTFGYDVYRGDSENGKFVRITKKPVLGNGTTSETHKY